VGALLRGVVAAVIALPVLCATSTAQSAQFFSVQASGLLMSLNGNSFTDLGFGTGVGGEFQVRVNPGGGFSVGAGFQITKHSASGTGFDDNLTLTGFFAEPRYTIRIRSRSARPYLAARLAYLRQSLTLQGTPSNVDATAGGSAFGVGGGFVYRLSRNVNFDLGAAFTSANFGNYKVGGVEGSEDAGSGSSFVVKAGLNVGIGR